MLNPKSLAFAFCGVAVCLFLVEESRAQSGRKTGSSTYRSRTSQGSEKKPVKFTGRLSGNLNDTVMMQVFDSNGDHVVSKKEVSNVLQLLTGLDSNGDGRITAEEMSEESIMTVAPRFAEDKERTMAREAEMKEKMEMEVEMKEKMEDGSQSKQ
jgi:hypothetical protein